MVWTHAYSISWILRAIPLVVLLSLALVGGVVVCKAKEKAKPEEKEEKWEKAAKETRRAALCLEYSTTS